MQEHEKAKAKGSRSSHDERPAKAKSQVAYEHLLRMIMNGELAPGEHLSEVDLLANLETGRTPLREAIHKLAEQKMVLIAPRRTPQVAPIMLSDLSAIPEARRIIEVPAARLAAERATIAERHQLSLANLEFKEALRDADLARMMAADNHIHQVIAAASHNAQLADAISRLNTQSYRILYMAAKGGSDLDELSEDCHDTIVNAVIAGKPEAAEAAMKEHNDEFTDRIRLISRYDAVLQLQ